MVRRSIGIRGYLGERIVEYWLEQKYPKEKGYFIIEEVVPQKHLKQGGNYLDFGVVRDDKVVAVYEVKTQDYGLKKHSFNDALIALWNKKNKFEKIIRQYIEDEKKEFKLADKFNARLVLLVPPPKATMDNLEKDEWENIMLMEEIFKDLKDKGFQIKNILSKVKEDLEEEQKCIKNPTKNQTLKDKFYTLRKEKTGKEVFI